MPPPTPRMIRLTVCPAEARSALGGLPLDEVAVDLAQRDGQRLLLRSGLDERTDVLEQALTELAVVGVDLPGPLGGDDHQRVLGLRAIEQLVDRRVGDAFGGGDGFGHVCASCVTSGDGARTGGAELQPMILATIGPVGGGPAR